MENTDTDSFLHFYKTSHTYKDVYSDSNASPRQPSHQRAHSRGDNPDRNAHTDCHGYPHANTHANPHRYTHTNSHGYPYTDSNQYPRLHFDIGQYLFIR